MSICRINERSACAFKYQIKLLACVLFIGIVPTWSQTYFGTVAVFHLSPEKVGIAEDSMGLIVTGDKVTGIYDHQCKITALGDKALFGGSGFWKYMRSGPNDPAPEYDFTGTARSVLRQ